MSAVMKEEGFHMRGIPAQIVERFWPFAEPYVKRALDHTSGELTHEDIKLGCVNRDIQLWMVSRDNRVYGAVTTEIVIYPRRKHCRIITVSGSSFSEWIQLVDETINAWASEQGCDAVEALVRKGFVPKLQQMSYKHKYSVVVKELPK